MYTYVHVLEMANCVQMLGPGFELAQVKLPTYAWCDILRASIVFF